jgi:hypothetical protein
MDWAGSLRHNAHRSFYVMPMRLTDSGGSWKNAVFTKSQIAAILNGAGIRFSEIMPYWIGVAIKAAVAFQT